MEKEKLVILLAVIQQFQVRVGQVAGRGHLARKKDKDEGRNCKTFSRTKAENAGNNMEVHHRRSNRDKWKDK